MDKMRKVLFLTSSRADSGKVIPYLAHSPNEVSCSLAITGELLLPEFAKETSRIESLIQSTYRFPNGRGRAPLDLITAETISGFHTIAKKEQPNLIVVHGDRLEALAGALTGCCMNVRVAHIEGGESSGSLDESLRYSISRLAHIHFVSNEASREKLIKMGEDETRTKVIGSADIDEMLKNDFPTLEEVQKKYHLSANPYVIVLFHPVMTEIDMLHQQVTELGFAVSELNMPCIWIGPNFDTGREQVKDALQRFQGAPWFHYFDHILFPDFITLMKHTAAVIGNSSAGIRESPVFGIPSINVGTRQQGRTKSKLVFHTQPKREDILESIKRALHLGNCDPEFTFGSGASTKLFWEALVSEDLWQIGLQKRY